MNLQVGPKPYTLIGLSIDPFKETLKGTLITTHILDPVGSHCRSALSKWEFPKIGDSLRNPLRDLSGLYYGFRV